MIKRNEKMKKNFPIVKVVSLMDSFRAIPHGTTSSYDCRLIGKYSVIYSAIRRLNQAAATEEFHLSTPDNGVTAVIHRK